MLERPLSVQRHGSQQTFTAEKLLIATGRRPNTQALGLEQAGVQLDQAGAVRAAGGTAQHLRVNGSVMLRSQAMTIG